MSTIITTGQVYKVSFITVPPTRGGCAWIGSSSAYAEIFYLQTSDNEPVSVREHKISMLEALSTALAGRLTVSVTHDSSSGSIIELFIAECAP